MPLASPPSSRAIRLAERILPTPLGSGEAPADRMAAARLLDRTQSTALTGLPLHAAMIEAARRALHPAPGTGVLRILELRASADAITQALSWAVGLEPLPRGPARFKPAPLPALRTGPRTSGAGSASPTRATASRSPSTAVRQGRLGDCWLVAVLAACELTRPGSLASRIDVTAQPESDRPGLVTVDLFAPVVGAPLLRRIPFLPTARRRVVMSDRVPERHRAGDAGLRPSAASLVEKAAVLVWADGSYRRLQNDFAGIGFLLLTGRWCPARPVPSSVEKVGEWLDAGRPVVLSTLKRPGGPFVLAREDGKGTSLAFMDAHVYVAVRVLHCDEDGRPGPDRPLRLHVRNPVGGPEGREHRRTNLYLSSAQLRRAFISANVGPTLM